MKNYTIPAYYFDKTLSEEEKKKKDWEMIARDFPTITPSNPQGDPT